MQGLELLRGAWEEILSEAQHFRFFHMWEWYYCYLKCIVPTPDDYLFFLFTKNKTPIAILPLRFTGLSLEGFKIRALSFPSHDHVPLCDMICRKDALDVPLFAILGQYLKEQNQGWDVMVLRHLLEDAFVMQAMQRHPPARFLIRHEGGCDFNITKGKTYESYISELSKNFRRSIKRARQYLEELPSVSFSFTNQKEELEKELEAFFYVEASGWKGNAGTGSAIRLHPELVSFYRELTGIFSASGKVLINTLAADGRCLAAQFCLLADKTVYMLKVGYDEAYGRYAPGKLLNDRFIKRCLEDPSVECINYATDTSWHADWAPGTYKKSICYIYNSSPAGLASYFLMKIYGVYVKPRLPGWMQKLLEPKSGADRK